MALFGQCKCKEGKGCPVHFFGKSKHIDKYESEKKSFESKYSKKEKKRTPEYETD